IPRKAEQEAKQRADAAAAKQRTDAEEQARAQAETRRKAALADQEARQRADAATAKKADEEAETKRRAELAEQEARQRAEADAAKKRADEETEAKRRAELAEQEARQRDAAAAEAARRRTELAEEERRRREASLGATAFDGVWKITRVGRNCAKNSHVFGVSIANGSFAQGYGTVSPSGEFKLLGRSLNTGERDLHYIGKLTGASGEGTFKADGGICAGTFTATRH